jgi:flavodoxin
MSDILIVYYSRTGKTRMVARKLADLLDADIEEIREAKGRSGLMGWVGGVKDSLMNKPAELISEHSVGARKVVIIGMPVWADRPPPAVRAFLRRYDLAGKKVCAFCTHDGSGGKGLFAKTAKILPGGLAATLALKKPNPDDRALDRQLRQWADEIRA